MTTTLDDLSLEQLDVLRVTGVLPPEELQAIVPTYSGRGRAYTDGTYLVFVDRETEPKAQETFLYNIGAEHEAKLVAKFRGITIYEGISESRLDKAVFATENP